jgi:hypothetical protein
MSSKNASVASGRQQRSRHTEKTLVSKHPKDLTHAMKVYYKVHVQFPDHLEEWKQDRLLLFDTLEQANGFAKEAVQKYHNMVKDYYKVAELIKNLEELRRMCRYTEHIR